MTGMSIKKDMLNKIADSIGTMGRRRVLIGIPAPENRRNDEAIGNAGLAYIHETGSGARNIPARPFLVPGVKKAEASALRVLKDAARKALSGDVKAIDKGLNAAGLIGQITVKQTVSRGEGFKPLAESTLAARRRKGFMGEKPLIRTGQLLNSITYVVKDK